MAKLMNYRDPFIDHLMHCLGIDPQTTRGFSLHVRMDEAVTVVVDEYVQTEGGAPPMPCERHYNLVPVAIKDPALPADNDTDDNIGDC